MITWQIAAQWRRYMVLTNIFLMSKHDFKLEVTLVPPDEVVAKTL